MCSNIALDFAVKFCTLLKLFVHFRYEEQLKERESQLQKEDLSDMVAEHAAKQKVSDQYINSSYNLNTLSSK